MSRDEPHLEELSSTVSAGLLAEETVFAIGRLLRGQALDTSSRRAIKQAADLLRAATSPSAPVADAISFQQLSTDDSALDALRAARVQAPDKDLQEYLQHLVAVLERAEEGEDVSTESESLRAVRELFASLGHFSLARANKLARTREERLTWTGSIATLRS